MPKHNRKIPRYEEPFRLLGEAVGWSARTIAMNLVAGLQRSVGYYDRYHPPYDRGHGWAYSLEYDANETN